MSQIITLADFAGTAIEKSFQNEINNQPQVDLSKGGEGSRGGKIIGHTKSGKPIYDKFNNINHKEFTQLDHRDAADLHRVLTVKHYNQFHTTKAMKHWSNGSDHSKESGRDVSHQNIHQWTANIDEKKISQLPYATLREHSREKVGSEYQKAAVKEMIDRAERVSPAGKEVTGHEHAMDILDKI